MNTSLNWESGTVGVVYIIFIRKYLQGHVITNGDGSVNYHVGINFIRISVSLLSYLFSDRLSQSYTFTRSRYRPIVGASSYFGPIFYDLWLCDSVELRHCYFSTQVDILETFFSLRTLFDWWDICLILLYRKIHPQCKCYFLLLLFDSV